MPSITQDVRPSGPGERCSPARGAGFARAVAIAALALSGATLRPQAAAADVTAGFSPATMTVAPGDTFTVTLAIPVADAAFNAFDASVRFDPAMVSYLPASNQRGALMTGACSNTFHQFNGNASDSLKITLSLLCSGVSVTGPGTLYTVRFIAGATTGTTTITLGPFTEFYNAGLFVRPLTRQDLSITIGSGVGVGDPDGGVHNYKMEFATPAPNPRRGSGAILLDFALPSADQVSFDVLDLQGRRVAGRDSQPITAGRHRLAWTPPALPNGDYFVRLRTLANGSVTQRWAVLR